MNDEHIIINIGRQLGSGGRDIARRLADDFRCAFFDRELLDLAARESGIAASLFAVNDENRGWLQHLFHLRIPQMGDNNFYRNNLSEESLFQFQSDAIRRAADRGNCVFVGRCADYILRDHKRMVNIFVSANLEQRVETVMNRRRCTHDEALKFIRRGESHRAAYYNFYTGKKWGMAESYDICINTSVMGVEETEEYLKTFVRKKLGL